MDSVVNGLEDTKQGVFAAQMRVFSTLNGWWLMRQMKLDVEVGVQGARDKTRPTSRAVTRLHTTDFPTCNASQPLPQTLTFQETSS